MPRTVKPSSKPRHAPLHVQIDDDRDTITQIRRRLDS